MVTKGNRKAIAAIGPGQLPKPPFVVALSEFGKGDLAAMPADLADFAAAELAEFVKTGKLATFRDGPALKYFEDGKLAGHWRIAFGRPIPAAMANTAGKLSAAFEEWRILFVMKGKTVLVGVVLPRSVAYVEARRRLPSR